MLPGLTATMGVALMTTLTFAMPPQNAILILVCMYIGASLTGNSFASSSSAASSMNRSGV